MRRRGRDLSADDRAVWSKVTRTVAPMGDRRGLRKADSANPPDMSAGASSRTSEDAASPMVHRGAGILRAAQKRAAPTGPTPSRSPLDTADPRRERLVARGRLEIDGVLDLHGMRQGEADRATTAFIARAVRRGHRVLLVITGKGSKEGGDGRGILRRRFLEGAEEGRYGSKIVSVRTAHQRHGGGGAFYVFLKNQRRGDRRP